MLRIVREIPPAETFILTHLADCCLPDAPAMPIVFVMKNMKKKMLMLAFLAVAFPSVGQAQDWGWPPANYGVTGYRHCDCCPYRGLCEMMRERRQRRCPCACGHCSHCSHCWQSVGVVRSGCSCASCSSCRSTNYGSALVYARRAPSSCGCRLYSTVAPTTVQANRAQSGCGCGRGEQFQQPLVQAPEPPLSSDSPDELAGAELLPPQELTAAEADPRDIPPYPLSDSAVTQ